MTREEKQELVKILKIGLKCYQLPNYQELGLCLLWMRLYFIRIISLKQLEIVDKYMMSCSEKRGLAGYWWFPGSKHPRIAWLKSTIKRLEKQLNETT